MNSKSFDVIATLCTYIDCIEEEAKKTMPDVIDKSVMENATPAEISLIKILLMIHRCKEEVTNPQDQSK